MQRLLPWASLLLVPLAACNWSIDGTGPGSSSNPPSDPPGDPAVTIGSDTTLTDTTLLPDAGAGLSGGPVLPSTPGLALTVAAVPPALDLAAETELDLVPANAIAPAAAPPAASDATAPLVATITVDPTGFPASASLEAEALAPYDGLAAQPTSFVLDASVMPVVPGELQVRVQAANDPSISALSNPLPTSTTTIRQLTEEVTDTFQGPWTEHDGRLFFRALNAAAKDKGFVFDPATGESRIVFDMNGFGRDEAYWPLGEFEGGLYLRARSQFLAGRRLYRYDGASDAVDPVEGHAPGLDTAPSELTLLDGAIFYVGRVAADQGKLLRLSLDLAGHPALLEQQTDLQPGGNDRVSQLTVHDGALYFSAASSASSTKLFRLDPGAGTLRQVTDLAPGNDSDAPTELTSLGDALYLSLRNGPGATKLHRLETATNTLVRVCNLSGADGVSDEPEDLTVVGGKLLFSAEGASGARKVYLLDPATDTLLQVSDTAGPGVTDDPRVLTALGTDVFFSAQNESGATKLYAVDVATGEWRQACELTGDASLDDAPGGAVAYGDRLYFSGRTAAGGGKLFMLEPSTGQAAQLTNLSGDAAVDDELTLALVLDDRLYFTALSVGGDVELFRLTDAETGLAP